MTNWTRPVIAAALLSSLSLMQAVQAQQIFLCVDAAGHKELTDTRKGPHCRPLDVPGGQIAAPKARSDSSAQRPRAAAQAATAPSDFPRVDTSEQRARDADRRQILQEELNGELGKLADMKREYNNGEPERRGDERNYAKYQERVANLKDSISRSEKNVEALRREISNIR
jgi:hypothetical protein